MSILIPQAISATTSQRGLVVLADNTTTKTGTSAVNVITAQGLLQSLGISEYAVSADTAITAGMSLTTNFATATTRIPKFAIVSIVCLTAELGYSVGDVVNVPQYAHTGTNVGYDVRMVAGGATMKMGSSVTPISLISQTTGASGAITILNWNVRLGIFG